MSKYDGYVTDGWLRSHLSEVTPLKNLEHRAGGEAAGSGSRSLRQLLVSSDANEAMVFLLLRSDENVVAFLSKSERTFRRFSQVFFVVTCKDLSEFRYRSLIAERLPDLEEIKNFGARRPWPEYLRRRHLILMSKWKPTWLLTYGPTFDEYLKEVERSINGISPRAI